MSDVAIADPIERTRRAPTLDALYQEVTRLEMTPGWIKRPQPILWSAPKSAFVAAHWRYDECKAALDAAGRLIDVALAERRNLVMRSPIPDNSFATTRTLVAAYQMILPGEHAPPHRHAPHALRVIIEAEGAYSNVNGLRTPMETGDVVLTPGWHWHSHGHDGHAPAYWFDGLDVPLTQLLEPMFYEEHPDPAGYERNSTLAASSPFRFTRADIARALDKAPPDAAGGKTRRIRLDAPSMAHLDLSVLRLESGAATERQRATINVCVSVMAGSGTSRVGETTIAWRRGDSFGIPCWEWQEHRASSDAELFLMTDEPLMRFANFYRAETA